MFSSLIVLLCETSHAPNHQPRFCCNPYEHCEHHQSPAIRQGQWGYVERDVRSVASHFQGLGQSWSALGNWLDTSCKYHLSLENALHKIAALSNHKRFNRRPRVTGRLRRKFVTRQIVLFGSLQALALPYQKSRDYYYPFNIIARHLNYSR